MSGLIQIKHAVKNQIRQRLLIWYDINKRSLPWRETNDPYDIWVSEVMLQQTQVATVIPYYYRFLDRFPHIRQLARADLQAVLKCWEGLGYYARARNLHRAADIVLNKYSGTIPSDHDAFRQLPGVGDYIAAAVQSIAFSNPYAVVDGNVKRVLARLFCLSAPVNQPKSLKLFKQYATLLLARKQPGGFNQAVMELGALVCTPSSPLCAECPLSMVCQAYTTKRVGEFPYKIKRRPIPQYQIAVGVIRRGSKILITQRQNQGLLGGLWEFPGGKIIGSEEPYQACLREIKEEVNLTTEIITFIGRIKHAYTHFKIVMDVFLCRYLTGKIVLNGPQNAQWVSVDDLDHYPFPKANHKFIPLLKKHFNEIDNQ